MLDSWQWLWRVTWHKGTAYGVAYGWDPKAPDNPKSYTASLQKSSDGTKYEKVTDFQIPNPTEATLAFEGDTMHCLQRRDGTPTRPCSAAASRLTRNGPGKTSGYFGGPNIIRHPTALVGCGPNDREGEAANVCAD